MRSKERLKGIQGMFNEFKGSSIYIQHFKSSIPLHFDMLNATPYSLSKEGNIFMVKNTPQGRKDKLDLLAILRHKFRKSQGLLGLRRIPLKIK